ncbi:hypothetical protein GOP47_0027629 [Adiantum capillus-veneris]|nr:hypothetical protein GOP47_0027629 [Adiantum capillus-veneris]
MGHATMVELLEVVQREIIAEIQNQHRCLLEEEGGCCLSRRQGFLPKGQQLSLWKLARLHMPYDGSLQLCNMHLLRG